MVRWRGCWGVRVLYAAAAYAASAASLNTGPRSVSLLGLGHAANHPAAPLLSLHRSFFHCGILVPCLEFCCSQVLGWPGGSNGGGSGAAPQQFVVQSLLLIYGVQKCSSYKGSASSLSLHSGARSQIEQLKSLAAEVAPALSAFWSPARLQAFVVATVEHLLPLTDKELQEW